MWSFETIAELALAMARIPPHQPVPMIPTSICSIVVLLGQSIAV
jgi:hypothetical protein